MSSNQNQDDFCHENVIARHQNFICGVFLWSEEHGVWVWCLRSSSLWPRALDLLFSVFTVGGDNLQKVVQFALRKCSVHQSEVSNCGCRNRNSLVGKS